MAMKITHVRMTQNSSHAHHISHFLTEYGTTFTREALWDAIYKGGDYASGIYPNPRLMAMNSSYGFKVVKSENNGSTIDNLTNLPRF